MHPLTIAKNCKNIKQGSKFVALADYVAVGHSEVSMREGDNIELLKVGCAGWWYVRILGNILTLIFLIKRFLLYLKCNFSKVFKCWQKYL